MSMRGRSFATPMIFDSIEFTGVVNIKYGGAVALNKHILVGTGIEILEMIGIVTGKRRCVLTAYFGI